LRGWANENYGDSVRDARRDHEYTDWQALDRFADELALLVDKGDANR
jgi:menaquinone-dependent protoporphyrinogen IX oxidase